MNKKTMMSILFVACAVVILAVALTHLTDIRDFLGGVFSMLSPIIVGLCMAFIFNVILNAIESKILFVMERSKKGLVKKLRRPLALVLTFIVVIGLCVLLVSVVTPSIGRALDIIVNEFPGLFAEYSQKLLNILEEYQIDFIFVEQGQIKWDQVINSVIGWFNIGTDNIVSVTTGVFSSIFNFILSLILSIYVLTSKEKIGKFLHLTMETCIRPKNVKKIERVMSLTYKTFARFITGQFIEAVILGVLCYLGMLLIGIPQAPVVSVIVGVTALIPMFGAWIGGAIGALFIVLDDPFKAFLFIVFILILQQLEGNIIYPKVVGDSIGLPGILVLCAVIIGGDIGGIPGILFGVPITSVAFTLLKGYVYDKSEKKNTLNGVKENIVLQSTKESSEENRVESAAVCGAENNETK